MRKERRQVLLEPRTIELVERLAEERGRSYSHIMRTAIREYVQEETDDVELEV